MTYTSIEDVEYEMHAIEIALLSMMTKYKELGKAREEFVEKIREEEVYKSNRRVKKRKYRCLCSFIKQNGRTVLLTNEKCTQHGVKSLTSDNK